MLIIVLLLIAVIFLFWYYSEKEKFQIADDVNIKYPCCSYTSNECPKDRCTIIDEKCVRKERLGCTRCRFRRFY